MEVLEVTPGLWRWTGHHEEWAQDVGCVYCETKDGVVLVDPLVPPEDSARFLDHLDREVSGREVHVLITVFWHGRSAAEVVERYGARVWGPKSGRAAIARRVGEVTDPFTPGDPLPGGVVGYRTARAAEVVYWIPEHATLVPGDVLVGDDAGGVEMCPASWLPAAKNHGDLAASLQPLLELPVERVLVSHGEPVLTDGARALARALAP